MLKVQKTVGGVKNKVSPYNYDLLKCLLSALIALQPGAPEIQTMLDLLEFLSCYSRCTPPGIMEQQSFFFRLPGSDEWPLKRLPMFYQIDTTMARVNLFFFYLLLEDIYLLDCGSIVNINLPE